MPPSNHTTSIIVGALVAVFAVIALAKTNLLPAQMYWPTPPTSTTPSPSSVGNQDMPTPIPDPHDAAPGDGIPNHDVPVGDLLSLLYDICRSDCSFDHDDRMREAETELRACLKKAVYNRDYVACGKTYGNLRITSEKAREACYEGCKILLPTP